MRIYACYADSYRSEPSESIAHRPNSAVSLVLRCILETSQATSQREAKVPKFPPRGGYMARHDIVDFNADYAQELGASRGRALFRGGLRQRVDRLVNAVSKVKMGEEAEIPMLQQLSLHCLTALSLLSHSQIVRPAPSQQFEQSRSSPYAK